MDLLGWVWWLLSALLGLGWSVIWFLLGGWVATLAQLLIVLGVIFSYKYGWRRAPVELMQRASTFGRFVWSWMRARELTAAPPATARPLARRRAGGVSRRELGDVNLSTLMSIAAIAGLFVIVLG